MDTQEPLKHDQPSSKIDTPSNEQTDTERLAALTARTDAMLRNFDKMREQVSAVTKQCNNLTARVAELEDDVGYQGVMAGLPDRKTGQRRRDDLMRMVNNSLRRNREASN